MHGYKDKKTKKSSKGMIKDPFKAWEATVRKTQAVAMKGAKCILNTITVPHENGSSGDINEADIILPNGDFYSGEWYDNLPHGNGKYLWTDGCMYEGEWVKGKTTGKGRFSWPSGATYEGEFKNGYMDGIGTYTESNGDTYKGDWVMDLRQGLGVKNFSNGDLYEGQWKRALQEGQGRYQWRDGSHYVGEWKNGNMCGKGTFTWANGNRFDGSWDEGLPKGNGIYKWVDGSFYSGYWSKKPSEQNGSYCPSGATLKDDQEFDPQDVYRNLAKYRICPSEKVLFLPSQKKLAICRSSNRRSSVDGRASVDSRGDMCERESPGNAQSVAEKELGGDMMALNLGVASFRANDGQPLRTPKTVNRQGEQISKGHKNYDLMLNLQLGIRHSVGRPAPAAELNSSDFDPYEKLWTRFPPEGTKYTPPHSTSEFKWKDYCPLVFRSLRQLFKVDAADYMLSICGDDALRELISPGKSGSFFYLTNDDRYMIKTMRKAEVKVLLRMIQAYYNHMQSFENTLLIKFYGLHCIKFTGGTTIHQKVRFIVMGNLFRSNYTIHRRFDLKGSTFGRTTEKPDSEIDSTTILKDLDLNFIFRLPKPSFQEFCRQIDRDCELLEQEGIMDYSLLVGLHFRETSPDGFLIPCGAPTPSATSKEDGTKDMDNSPDDSPSSSSTRLGQNMAIRAERTVRKGDAEQLVGEPTGELYDVIIIFGIIDILQHYDISKKLEHAYKSFQYDATSISAVDPIQYSKRFRDFIYKIFVED